MKNFILIIFLGCFTSVSAQVYADFETVFPMEENAIIWGASSNGVANNPSVDDVNSSANVAFYIQQEQWCVYHFCAGENIDLAGGNYKIYMDVYSAIQGRVWLKLESCGGGGDAIEAYAEYTSANKWQTLEFNFTVPENGNRDALVSAFSIYFNHGAVSADTWYWDNVEVGEVSTRIKGNKTNASIIYPNPVADKLNVDLCSSIQSISIYSITGTKLESTNLIGNKLDVTALPKGTYILQIIDMDGETMSQKFVKK
nr:T9SS type A sorting domain-containing protein [uncultured Carboxylicivirga sp.]